MTETDSTNATQAVGLNDRLIRIIGIPFFGVAIPLASGILKDVSVRDPKYWFSFLVFIVLSGLIWQGNRYLLFRTRKRFTWFDKPKEKLVLLVVNNVFYTAPLTIAVICSWYAWMGIPRPDWSIVQLITLINIICVLFITHVYETVFMLKEQQNEQVKNEQLQRAKAEAELLALRNQVDPHFMFNSLNTLTYLISNNPETALHFTESLADIYRYILAQKDRPLVMLEDELDFTHKYTSLLHLRFGKALIIEKLFDDTSQRKYLIPPNSVFMAFENAVKHNEISEENPLHITVDVQPDNLVISNSVRPRANRYPSAHIGLANLEERFRLITGRNVRTESDGNLFTLIMPMIPITG